MRGVTMTLGKLEKKKTQPEHGELKMECGLWLMKQVLLQISDMIALKEREGKQKELLSTFRK